MNEPRKRKAQHLLRLQEIFLKGRPELYIQLLAGSFTKPQFPEFSQLAEGAAAAATSEGFRIERFGVDLVDGGGGGSGGG